MSIRVSLTSGNSHRDGRHDPKTDTFFSVLGALKPPLMQRFHNLGLIETNRDRFLIIEENKLTDYLPQIRGEEWQDDPGSYA